MGRAVLEQVARLAVVTAVADQQPGSAVQAPVLMALIAGGVPVAVVRVSLVLIQRAFVLTELVVIIFAIFILKRLKIFMMRVIWPVFLVASGVRAVIALERVNLAYHQQRRRRAVGHALALWVRLDMPSRLNLVDPWRVGVIEVVAQVVTDFTPPAQLVHPAIGLCRVRTLTPLVRFGAAGRREHVRVVVE